MRNHVREFAAITQNTDQEVMLPRLGARQDAKAAFAESPKSSPVAPRQFCPCGPALIPMQDDCVVGG